MVETNETKALSVGSENGRNDITIGDYKKVVWQLKFNLNMVKDEVD